MTNGPVIAAFDIATLTGVCWGEVGSKQPSLATWDTRTAGVERPYRLNLFFNLCSEFLEENKISQLWYEAPMRLSVMAQRGPKRELQIKTTEQTLSLLRGMVGVLEVCAVRAGLEPQQIRPFTAQDAREHLTGRRTHGKSKSGKSLGKAAVMDVARMLGVNCANDNEGDAFAGWSYACALNNHRIAHLVTPLFAGR